jgi:hypothetical protein
MKAPGLLFLALYGKVPSLDGAYVVTDIENFRFNLGTFAQISQLSTEGQVTPLRSDFDSNANRWRSKSNTFTVSIVAQLLTGYFTKQRAFILLWLILVSMKS